MDPFLLLLRLLLLPSDLVSSRAELWKVLIFELARFSDLLIRETPFLGAGLQDPRDRVLFQWPGVPGSCDGRYRTLKILSTSLAFSS